MIMWLVGLILAVFVDGADIPAPTPISDDFEGTGDEQAEACLAAGNTVLVAFHNGTGMDDAEFTAQCWPTTFSTQEQ
jgi:hypothetical protein